MDLIDWGCAWKGIQEEKRLGGKSNWLYKLIHLKLQAFSLLYI